MVFTVDMIEKEACTGCGACKNICPTNAISMETDQEGFWYPAINREVCVHCHKCVKICPAMRERALTFEEEDKKQVKIYAAWSKNPEIRFGSTSGGVFSELALSVLESGGCVCGAVYDKSHMVNHMITNDKKDLDKLRQSKYIQSNTGYIYQEAGACLKQGRQVLFCGTPCQCEGLFCYCKEKKISIEKLYLVDFICRGSNSPKVYSKFLAEMKNMYQSDIKKVWFKNKTYGWNRFSTKIEFEDGEQYLEDRYHDSYIRGYIEENLFIRPSCANCKFKGFNRIADITLADFWGVQLEGQRQQESDGGTSMVMLHTEKGEALWNKIFSKVFQEEKKLEDIIPGNVCFYNSVQQGVHRDKFMQDLDKMPVIENIERFLKGNDRWGEKNERSES